MEQECEHFILVNHETGVAHSFLVVPSLPFTHIRFWLHTFRPDTDWLALFRNILPTRHDWTMKQFTARAETADNI